MRLEVELFRGVPGSGLDADHCWMVFGRLSVQAVVFFFWWVWGMSLWHVSFAFPLVEGQKRCEAVPLGNISFIKLCGVRGVLWSCSSHQS